MFDIFRGRGGGDEGESRPHMVSQIALLTLQVTNGTSRVAATGYLEKIKSCSLPAYICSQRGESPYYCEVFDEVLNYLPKQPPMTE